MADSNPQIDYMTVAYSVHRLNGIVTPANAAYSAQELTHQLKTSDAKALFVSVPLLETALEAAKAVGLSHDKIWIVGMPGFEKKDGFVTVEELIAEGARAPKVDELKWAAGQGARQTAFLCFSSGTSGLPKAVMISHRNVIANTMQYALHESLGRKLAGVETQSVLGLLPFSHIYALVIIAHANTYRGDEVVVLPRFEMPTFLSAIERFKLAQLYLVSGTIWHQRLNGEYRHLLTRRAQVPPIIIRMTKSYEECKKYNLDSVRLAFSGAAPLGEETIQDMKRLWPKWRIAQGYGELLSTWLT